jgi:hypothetical protein
MLESCLNWLSQVAHWWNSCGKIYNSEMFWINFQLFGQKIDAKCDIKMPKPFKVVIFEIPPGSADFMLA